MKLSRIEVKNYKSISHIVANIDDLTAIVGKNNYGKSALLDAIQCFYGDKSINDDDFHMGKEENIEISLLFTDIVNEDIERYFNYKSMYNKTMLKIMENDGNDALKERELRKLDEKRLQKFDETTKKFCLDLEQHDSILIKFIKPKRGNSIYKLSNDTTVAKNDFCIKVISAIRTPDKETTAGTKSNMKELISLLQEQQEVENYIKLPNSRDKLTYGEIKALISTNEEEQCRNLSTDLTTHFQEAISTDTLSVKVKIEEGFKFDFKYKTVLIDRDMPHKEIDILSCGTGLQSMMILSILQTYIKMMNDSNLILLIEEPEVYLHPSLQRKMINTLVKIGKKNQVLLTTHSPIIISKIDQQNIHCINKVGGVSSIIDATATTIIEELGIQVSDILNKNAVLFVEGKDDNNLFTALFNKLATNMGLGGNFTLKEIDIIQTDGYDKMDFYANAKILHKDVVKTPYWVITDSDGEEIPTRKASLVKKGTDNGVTIDEGRIKILTEYAIESYFLDPTILTTLFPKLGFEELKALCDCYFSSYETALDLLRQNKFGKKQHFRAYFKPKIMFSDLDKPQQAINQILDTQYSATHSVKETRNKLIREWASLEDPISKVIDSLDIVVLKETRISEIINVVEEIITEIAPQRDEE
ncbi:ATP-dependent nuclease [Bacillus litorisediminis]|uniref:ATP-dependent nuclease n=1 Tax=Bacillus litorisediminis TaxID=2922713 RepID=UPI001FAB5440|nr:AAA family ATPase [Bacillus litorisediminis]